MTRAYINKINIYAAIWDRWDRYWPATLALAWLCACGLLLGEPPRTFVDTAGYLDARRLIESGDFSGARIAFRGPLFPLFWIFCEFIGLPLAIVAATFNAGAAAVFAMAGYQASRTTGRALSLFLFIFLLSRWHLAWCPTLLTESILPAVIFVAAAAALHLQTQTQTQTPEANAKRMTVAIAAWAVAALAAYALKTWLILPLLSVAAFMAVRETFARRRLRALVWFAAIAAENFRIDVARGSADQPTVGSDSRLAFVFQAV